MTSHDVVAATRRRLGRGVKVGHAGTLDPFATGLLLVLVGRATRVQRFLMALPKRYETVARLGWTSTTGDPEGELAPGRDAARAARAADRAHPPAPAGLLGGQGRRASARTRRPARGETVELPEREVEVTRFEQLWRDGDRAAFAIECSSGTYVRSAGRRPRRRLLPRAAADGDRRRSTSPTPTRSGSSRSATRWRSCPRCALERRGRPPRGARRGGAPARRDGHRAPDRRGRADRASPSRARTALLKPVVGFRA